MESKTIQSELLPNFYIQVQTKKAEQLIGLINPDQYQDNIYHEKIYADSFIHAMRLTMLFCSTHKIDPIGVTINAI